MKTKECIIMSSIRTKKRGKLPLAVDCRIMVTLETQKDQENYLLHLFSEANKIPLEKCRKDILETSKETAQDFAETREQTYLLSKIFTDSRNNITKEKTISFSQMSLTNLRLTSQTMETIRLDTPEAGF